RDCIEKLTVAVIFDTQAPRCWAGDFQRQTQMLLRQASLDAVGPLDQAHSLAVEVFVDAKVEKLHGATEAVGVEVVNRQARRVLLDQHESWAADDAAVGNGQALGDG